jgi:hypothetical protein
MNTMFRANVTRMEGSTVQILRPAETGDALALLKAFFNDIPLLFALECRESASSWTGVGRVRETLC